MFALLKRLIIEHGNWRHDYSTLSTILSRGKGTRRKTRRGAFLRGRKIRDRYRDITRDMVTRDVSVWLGDFISGSGISSFHHALYSC